jgi:hypothetical protein
MSEYVRICQYLFKKEEREEEEKVGEVFKYKIFIVVTNECINSKTITIINCTHQNTNSNSFLLMSR